jgi:hypothetical protein
VEFRSVLYIPGMAPLSNEEIMNPKTKNIRLYVKRVFISDDFDGELVCCYKFSLFVVPDLRCRRYFSVTIITML